MAIGVALLGAAELVGAWVTRAATDPDGGSVQPALLVRTVGENDG